MPADKRILSAFRAIPTRFCFATLTYLRYIPLFCLFTCSFPVSANSSGQSETLAGPEWELVKADAEELKVYYRTLPSGNVQFKGVTTVQSSLSTLIAVFLDLDSMPKWLYRTKQATLLERVGSVRWYVHMLHTMPFPFRPRDSVNFIEMNQAPDTKTVYIDVTNVPDYIDPIEDHVRVQVAVSQWRLQPAPGGKVEITFTGYGEPGGSISSQTYHTALFRWLVKQFLWEVPYDTLLKLRQFIHLEQYQNRRFDFIKELNSG